MKIKVKPKSIFPTTEPKQNTCSPKVDLSKTNIDITSIPVVRQKPKQSIISRVINIIVGDIMSFLHIDKKKKEEERINKMRYDEFMELIKK